MSATGRPQGLKQIWPNGSPLIGMVHLLPLPGSPRWGGSMAEVLDRAAADARALAEAGFAGVLVENFLDAPFFGGAVPSVTVSAITVAVTHVASAVDCPLGVNVLRNDVVAALGIATATGARFVRANVHTGSMWTDQGLIEGRANETLRLRQALGADIAILADVHVKHATPPVGSKLESSARDTWHRGLADALVVSGQGTGQSTKLGDVLTVRKAVPEATLLVGSGLTLAQGPELLAAADGAIVGTSIMNDERPGAGIDPGRAAAFVRALRP